MSSRAGRCIFSPVTGSQACLFIAKPLSWRTHHRSQWARVSLRTARTNIEKGEDGAGCIAAADVEGEAGVHADWLVIRIKAAQHRNVAAANHRACWRVPRRHPCL